MLGPLGISLVNQVKQSRALTGALLPLANALARASGHRQLGLKYDDLSENLCHMPLIPEANR